MVGIAEHLSTIFLKKKVLKQGQSKTVLNPKKN